jgi:hypothetical protein
MFGTIRKHQGWLWMVVIFFTVISFVVFFSPNAKMSDAWQNDTYNLGSISGEKVTVDAYQSAAREAILRFFLNNSQWPDRARKEDFDEQREAYIRLFLLQKVQEQKISVGRETVANLAANFIRSFQRSGINSPEAFEKAVLQPRGLTLIDLRRTLAHELAIQQLVSLHGICGNLINPKEVESVYRHERQQINAQMAVLHATNYLAAVSLTPDMVSRFYSNRVEQYRIAPKVQVCYAFFDVTNYLSKADKEMAEKADIVNKQVEEFAKQLGTNASAKTIDEVKAQVRLDIRTRSALIAARLEAVTMTDKVMDSAPSNQVATLAAMAREAGVSVKQTAPFDKEASEFPKEFAELAFALTGDEPVKGPIIGTNGVYVLGLTGTIPSRIPPMEEIRNRVTENCRTMEAQRLCYMAGLQAYAAITNSMIQNNKSFRAAALGAGLQEVDLPPFSRNTVPTNSIVEQVENYASFNSIQQVAFSTPTGKVSSFVPSLCGGFVLYVKEQIPLGTSDMADLPAFQNMIRRTFANEAFNAWMSQQARTALRNTPLFQEQTPTITSGAAQEQKSK